MHELWVLPDDAAASAVAAELIAGLLRAARVDRPDRPASVGFSGGSSPLAMFSALARAEVEWGHTSIFQVDERVAPDGGSARNLVDLRTRLTDAVVPEGRLHPMPVELGADTAADRYAATLQSVLGDRPALDVVHLGLGGDGHCASLVPDDPVLGVNDRDVASTEIYQGHRRVTVTYPMLERARVVVWLVIDPDRTEALDALLRADPSIPAGRVSARRSVVVTTSAVRTG